MYSIQGILAKFSQSDIEKLKNSLPFDSGLLPYINLLTQENALNQDQIIKNLGYKHNIRAYYTLKHRLINQLVFFKYQQGKNKVIGLQEDINNLRSLLFSNQSELLKKNISDLLKRAEDLNTRKSVREIYLCMYILYFNDKSKRTEAETNLFQAEENERQFNKLEKIFFQLVLTSQDQYYLVLPKMQESLQNSLSEMEAIHLYLKDEVSSFLYISSLISYRLDNGQIDKMPDISEQLEYIQDLYLQTPLQYYYPNCKFAIQCLFSKYYLEIGKLKLYEKSIKELGKYLDEIRDYPTYENVYFYYLYALLYNGLLKHNIKKANVAINNEISEKNIANASNKMQAYLYYLLGVSAFYNEQFDKAHSYFLKNRALAKYLYVYNKWILIEGAIFVQIILIKNQQTKLLGSEKKFLLRKIEEEGFYSDKFAPLLNYMRLLRNPNLYTKKTAKEICNKNIKWQSQNRALKLLDFNVLTRIVLQNETVTEAMQNLKNNTKRGY